MERVRFAANIRGTDDTLLQEFDAAIIPRFGACDANDLERREDRPYHALGAWAAPSESDPHCRPLALRFGTPESEGRTARGGAPWTRCART
ncbi:MAG: hypothetical protein EOO71_01025 [Myxococcaceae bacterium]|nr:MAG: hypothetical protein EOO71_01025 [Myxococcaceae bacterium]